MGQAEVVPVETKDLRPKWMGIESDRGNRKNLIAEGSSSFQFL